VTRRLRLRRYLEDPGDGRQQPQIPAQALLWALLLGQILRQSSFHAVEALAHTRARRNLSFSASFCDDTLGYFTERLDPGPTRQALLSIVRRAKRNKAFDDCRWIGLAIDGTGAGWRAQQGCSLCRPQRNAEKQILGYQHSMVLISVVGTGLSLPCDVEPYGPGDSEYAAGSASCGGLSLGWGNVLRSTWWSMGNSLPHRSCIPPAIWDWRWWQD